VSGELRSELEDLGQVHADALTPILQGQPELVRQPGPSLRSGQLGPPAAAQVERHDHHRQLGGVAGVRTAATIDSSTNLMA
jgi:hypothetical protein